jgi:MFS family permease
MISPTISYWQLIRLPNVLALLSATGLSRLAGRMFMIVIVFHALAVFGSPSLAGWIAFAAIAPGLVVSPLAGAFLDRAGAARGVVVDLAVSSGLVLALAVWIGVGWASPSVVLLLAAVFALTSPLGAAGVRVLLPRLVPSQVLDRANALDTAVDAVAEVIGPSVAGALVGLAGSIAAFAVIAIAYAGATICILLVQGAAPRPLLSRPLFGQAVEALVYVFRGKLLRGLAIGYALNNFVWGVLVVAVPVFVARQFDAGTWESVSGLLWACMGAATGIGALAAGQFRLLGREKRVMTICMIATAFAVWPVAAVFGIFGLGVGLVLTGLLAGPIDVGLLTLRQRRTDPDRLGRLLAVSMSVNTAGFPIGTALGGMLVAWSLQSAFIAAALASLLGALTTYALVPADDQDMAS